MAAAAQALQEQREVEYHLHLHSTVRALCEHRMTLPAATIADSYCLCKHICAGTEGLQSSAGRLADLTAVGG